MRYRKKPVVIEAWKSSDLNHRARCAWDSLPECVRDAYELGKVIFALHHIEILTPEGLMHAGSDDMVIRGIKGELYPCKPDIFEATYEPAEEPTP